MDFRRDYDMNSASGPAARTRNLGIEAGLRGHSRAPSVAPPHKPPRSSESNVGAQARYSARLRRFVEDGRPLPKLRHHALWMLHNCVAHPLLAAAGKAVSPLAVEFHELTSLWLDHQRLGRQGISEGPNGPGRSRVLSFRLPEVRESGPWMLHNIAAHVAIGLLPCKATFDLHDWSARVMGVPGWV